MRQATRLTEHDKAALDAIARAGGYVMCDTSGLTQAGNARPLTAGRFQRLVTHGRLVAAGDALFDGMPSQTYQLCAVDESAGGWTVTRIAALRRLWAEGWSASQIAGRLGGITRNAVIGKVHRLKLPARRTCQRAQSRRVNQQGRRNSRAPTGRKTPPFVTPPAAAFVPAKPIQEAREAPTPLRVALLDILDGQCRWPLGDPKTADFAFCGGPTHPGSAYCNHHHRRAHK